MRALLVDYGGVLTTNVFESFRAFSRAEGLEPDALVRVLREQPEALAELERLERGELGDAEFSSSLGTRLGVASHERLIERLLDGAVPDERLIGAVRAARRAGFATGVVSNSWGTGLYSRAGTVLELFDAVVLSGEVGLRKPQPEIFLLAAERIGASPEGCVFVDDLRANCAGAAAVGMTPVLHRDSRETVAELERLLGVPPGSGGVV